MDWRMYAMGFSPAAHEYKLFRFSFPFGSEEDNNHLDVYTLGDGRGWRRYPILFPYAAVYGLQSPPPVFVDGKQYLVVHRHRSPNRILVIDLASEARCTYRLPYQHTTSPTSTNQAGRPSLTIGTVCCPNPHPSRTSTR